jgi:hypothetical protein
VDDRHESVEDLERDRGQGVRQVVAVDEVGAKLSDRLPKSSSPEPYHPLRVLPW